MSICHFSAQALPVAFFAVNDERAVFWVCAHQFRFALVACAIEEFSRISKSAPAVATAFRAGSWLWKIFLIVKILFLRGYQKFFFALGALFCLAFFGHVFVNLCVSSNNPSSKL
jgi:hypothetical protein